MKSIKVKLKTELTSPTSIGKDAVLIWYYNPIRKQAKKSREKLWQISDPINETKHGKKNSSVWMFSSRRYD